MAKAETIFTHELNMIHDKTIKQFVIECFDKLCPDYFWTCPCSTTGKYHPQIALGVGGLVRHTKLAVWWGLELINALRKSPGIKSIPPDKLIDETVATLLLHDMIKNGKGLNAQGRPFESGVTGTHGVTLAKKILDLDATFDIVSRSRIIYGISEHMGIWTVGSLYKPSGTVKANSITKAFANLIHLADYCASRKVDSIYRKLENDLGDQIDLELAKTALKRNDFVSLEEIITELDKEKTNGITKNPTTVTGIGKNIKVTKSPPCPGVRSTEIWDDPAEAENGK